MQKPKTQRNANIKILRYGDNPVPVTRLARIFAISTQRVYVILKAVPK